MNNFVLNVYDKKGKTVVKTCKASTCDIMFGTINKLMKLLQIDNLSNNVELIKIIYDAWEELQGILSEIFPNIVGDDWDGVKIKELLPIVISIAKFTIADLMSIPVDPKN